MRVPVRIGRRLRARHEVLRGRHLDLPTEAPEPTLSALPLRAQYVVVIESIFGFTGHESPRTARSTHAATPAFAGFV